MTATGRSVAAAVAPVASPGWLFLQGLALRWLQALEAWLEFMAMVVRLCG